MGNRGNDKMVPRADIMASIKRLEAFVMTRHETQPFADALGRALVRVLKWVANTKAGDSVNRPTSPEVLLMESRTMDKEFMSLARQLGHVLARTDDTSCDSILHVWTRIDFASPKVDGDYLIAFRRTDGKGFFYDKVRLENGQWNGLLAARRRLIWAWMHIQAPDTGFERT